MNDPPNVIDEDGPPNVLDEDGLPFATNTFVWSSCIVCAEYQHLNRCGACHTVAYCSREHQRMHWPSHKVQCQRLLQMGLYRGEGDAGLLQATLEERSKEWIRRVRLHGFFHPDLQWMVFRMPKCVMCLAGVGRLRNCHGCRSVWWCPEHEEAARAQHVTCEQVAQGRYLQKMLMRGCRPVLVPGVVDHARLQTWDDYFAQKPVPSELPPDRCPQRLITQHGLSRAMTVLYALHQLGLQVGRTMRIHVIGADSCESVDCPQGWEEVMHWLPQVEELHIVLVGEELTAGGLQDSMHPHAPAPAPRQIQLCPCPECTDAGKTLSMTMVKGLYHNVVDQLPPANFCAAFNSGAHDPCYGDSWARTLQTLGCPGVFTSYTEDEAHRDKEVLERAGVGVDMCSKNPFASSIARDDPCVIESLFRENDWFIVFK